MTNTSDKQGCALVIGACGAIGSALIDQFLAQTDYDVIAVSRQSDSTHRERLRWLQTDHSDASLADIVNTPELLNADIQRVIICTGVLHGDAFRPEKKIEQLRRETLEHVIHVNAVLPIAWLQSLTPLLLRSSAVVAVLSARVGSIEDNRSGGWYSYRSSKAALNMLLKSLSVEYARRAPGVKLIAFHPGTTDSALSRPFQKSVPDGKLFTPAFVADQLLRIMKTMPADGALSFLDWQGQPIDW